MNEYDPEVDGELLEAPDVCRLLHVSRSHLPNLRKNGTLRGWQPTPNGKWKYPSLQPTLRDALTALRAASAQDTAP